MRLDLKNYSEGRLFALVARDCALRENKLKENLNVLFIQDNQLILYPSNISLEVIESQKGRLEDLQNNDVVEITDKGALYKAYSDESQDNILFITGKCNSNCIMCPSPEFSRMHSAAPDLEGISELIRYIPSDTSHLTITGGEPFLAGRHLFKIFRTLKDKFEQTEFLILTNGRIFCLPEYVEQLRTAIPEKTLLAVPVHASNAELHDQITQTPNSFAQTFQGIQNLLQACIPVELRIVVSALNLEDLPDLGRMIVTHFPTVNYVSVIAMEMTGSARVNRKEVWVPYRTASKAVVRLTEILMEGGVDVKLYNFPLCTVDRSCWLLCRQSISENKVRYLPQCETCSLKSSCGGLFAGTADLEKEEIKPVYGNELL